MKPIVTVEEFPESPDQNVIYVKLSTREVLFYTPLGFTNFAATLPSPQDLFLDTSVTVVGSSGSDGDDSDDGSGEGSGDGDDDYVLPKSNHETNYYSTTDLNYGDFICVSSPDLPMAGVFSKVQDETHNGVHYYERSLGNSSNEAEAAESSDNSRLHNGDGYFLDSDVGRQIIGLGTGGGQTFRGLVDGQNYTISEVFEPIPGTSYYEKARIANPSNVDGSGAGNGILLWRHKENERTNPFWGFVYSDNQSKTFFFWTGTEWALALSKTSDLNDFLAYGGAGVAPTNPAKVSSSDWTTNLTNFSVDLVSQYKVDIPNDYTDSDTEWFGYYVYDSEGALWDDGNSVEFRTTPHASIFAYRQIAYLDKTAVRVDSQHFIIGEYTVNNGCSDSYKDLSENGIDVQVAEEGSDDPRITTITDSEIIINYPEGSINSNEDIDSNIEGIQVRLNSNEALNSSTSFPENTSVIVPFCDGTVSYALSIYKTSDSEYLDLESVAPLTLKNLQKFMLSTDVDEALIDIPFVSENICLNNGFLNFNFLNSNFVVDETVAELTPDVFTQGLFSSSNNYHMLAVQNLEGKYNIDSPVGPEFDQPMSTSEWTSDSNSNLVFRNNLISPDTYAWEVSANLTLPPASVYGYGPNRTMSITLQKTTSVINPTPEELESYTPIGSYKIKSLTIN